jgi:hypothetical protein
MKHLPSPNAVNASLLASPKFVSKSAMSEPKSETRSEELRRLC